MKVAYIIPGSGDKFYCENCMRDLPLVKELQKQGVDVTIIPLYLPLFIDEEPLKEKVFYGAINMYLKDRYKIFYKTPDFIRRLFDSKPFLKLAASMSGATSAKGLEEMTLSLLRGEDKTQQQEFNRLIDFLDKSIQPDLIHISNALLIGLGIDLKHHFNIPLICSLQDEDTWLDSMGENYRNKAWRILQHSAQKTDYFLPVSNNFKKVIQKKTGLELNNSRVVPIGLELTRYKIEQSVDKPLAIGYLSRLTESFGLDILARTYILLKKELPSLKFYITGGYTSGDKPFVKKVKKILREYISNGDVVFMSDFHIDKRNEFFNRISILSVPMKNGEAFGTYQIEAMAFGVPVVQPAVGAFPEIIESTGGGITYSPNNHTELSKVMLDLLADKKKLAEYGQSGRRAVEEQFTIQHMASAIRDTYREVLNDINA